MISKFRTLLVFKQCWKNRVKVGHHADWSTDRLLKFLLNRNSGKLFTTSLKPIWKNRQGNSAAAAVVGEHSKKAFSFLYIFFPSLAFSCRWYFSKDRYSQQQPHAMIWIQRILYALELQCFFRHSCNNSIYTTYIQGVELTLKMILMDKHTCSRLWLKHK